MVVLPRMRRKLGGWCGAGAGDRGSAAGSEGPGSLSLPGSRLEGRARQSEPGPRVRAGTRPAGRGEHREARRHEE